MSENPIFSYTKRDYEGSRKEGLSKIPSLSKGKWTDLNATDPGIIILDYVHALVDMVNYYQDHQALETFITTAKERANIFRIAKQLSYDIRSSKGAVCDVTFTSVLAYDYIIKIPKHTALSTRDGIPYLTMEDTYLLPGSHQVTVRCTQGTLKQITYTGTGISRFSNVENAKNQSIRLADNHIDIDSITITDSVGRVWTPVEYITFSDEVDRVYQVDLDPNDSVTIKFGDGERGIVPQDTDTLTITYMSNLAEDGRVGANSIVVLTNPIYNESGQYIEFLVTNASDSTGGSSTQSSQEIKELAPGAIKAQDRAVTLSDFENLAKLVDGVADAKAYDVNTRPTLPYHVVKVLIIPSESVGSDEVLKDNVYNYLYSRMIPPTNLQVFTPAPQYININVTVKKLGTIGDSSLNYSINQAIKNYFSSRAGAIGESFYPSDISATIANVEGVRYVISITPNTIVEVGEDSVVKLGTVTITIQ